MTAYLTESEFCRSALIHKEKAWYLFAILLELGRPALPEEIAARCTLFCASSDFVEFLCSIPNSPLFINENRFVTISLDAFSALREFVSKAITSFVPRPWVSNPVEKRLCGDHLRTYMRKRKILTSDSNMVPNVRRRLLLCSEDDDKILSHSCEAHVDVANNVRSDLSFLSGSSPVWEYASRILNQKRAMPPLLLDPNSIFLGGALESIDCMCYPYENTIRRDDTGCMLKERELSLSLHLPKCQHNFLNVGPLLNIQDEKIDQTIAEYTGTGGHYCWDDQDFPDAGTSKENAEKSGPAYNIAQVGELKRDAVIVLKPTKIVGGIMEIVTMDQTAEKREIPEGTPVVQPLDVQKLPVRSFDKRKALQRDTLNPGLQSEFAPLEESTVNNLQEEQVKLDEKFIHVKQKGKRSRCHNVCSKENKADSTSKVPKISEQKSLPNFESFIVEEEEGSGGYGTVYRARRKNDGKIVAVKCPHSNAPSHHVSNELKMLERFGGRNFVIKYEGSFKTGNSECFVLEHVEHDRPEVLKREIRISELHWYGYCMFKALATLHKQGIVHRDVKPGNFLFSRKLKKGYLIDFNLAMDLHQKYSRSSKLGKMNYKGSFDNGPIIKEAFSTKEVRKVVNGGFLAAASRASAKDSKLLPHGIKNTKKRADMAPHLKNLADIGNKVIYRSQGGDASGVTSTRTPSGERLREPVPCQGRKELINLVQEAMQCPNQEVTSPASHRKRVAPPPCKEDRRLVYISPMPLVSGGIPVSGSGSLKNKDGKQKREGPCVGTKGFRAPEVLLKSPHQGPKVDVWSAGVTLLYLMIGKAPFVGDPEHNINDIAKLRGSEDLWEVAKLHNRECSFPENLLNIQSLPSKNLQGWCETNTKRPDFHEQASESLFDLVDKCLTVNPRLRISAEEALMHNFFAPCHEAFRKQKQLRRALPEHRSMSQGDSSSQRMDVIM